VLAAQFPAGFTAVPVIDLCNQYEGLLKWIVGPVPS